MTTLAEYNHTYHYFLLNQKLSTIAGCLQLLEIYWNLKTLLEILEISLNFYGPPGNFCIKCR